jgi:hypothetical protein
LRGRVLLLLVVLLGFSGCTNPKQTVIPADMNEWETKLKPTINSLSAEERTLLAQYMMRSKLGEAFGGSSRLGTITVGEAIQEQRRFLEREADKELEAKRLKESLAQEQLALQQEFDRTLSVVLVGKEFHKADYQSSEFQDEIRFTLGIQNKTDKAIKGFKGLLIFKDMFDDTIKGSRLSFDDGVGPKDTIQWVGVLHFNQFIDEDKKLASIPEAKLKLSFEPEVVLFSDGSELKMPGRSSESR